MSCRGPCEHWGLVRLLRAAGRAKGVLEAKTRFCDFAWRARHLRSAAAYRDCPGDDKRQPTRVRGRCLMLERFCAGMASSGSCVAVSGVVDT